VQQQVAIILPPKISAGCNADQSNKAKSNIQVMNLAEDGNVDRPWLMWHQGRMVNFYTNMHHSATYSMFVATTQKCMLRCQSTTVAAANFCWTQCDKK